MSAAASVHYRPLLSTLFLLSWCHLFGQLKMDRFPDHQDVLHRLYDTYRVAAPGSVAKLAKMPDGWWLQYEVDDSVTTRYQLWSFQKRKYLEPGLPKLERGEEPSAMAPFEDTDWTATYYRACPYFGYRGWFTDVIREYGEVEDLPSYARYGLGRAYSSAARCLLDDLQSEGPIDYAFLSDSGDVLSSTEMRTYMDLFQKACETYSDLFVTDPAFETHIGEIALKRDHEYMTGFMDMMMAGEPEAALRCVPLDAYAPFYRKMARGYLASCDSNAILFTNGDTDTFPLWYVQVVEGYRRDVLVLNLSLLNASRYVRAMRSGQLGSQPAGWQLPDRFYWSKRSSFAFLEESSEPLSLTELVNELRAHDNEATGGMAGDITLPTNRFQLTGPGGMSITWSVSKRYLLRNALAVFDLLAHNAAQRPFHWAVTTGPDSYFGLAEHMALQGLTYKLMFDSIVPDLTFPNIPSRVLTERSNQVFMDLFAMSSSDTSTINRARMVTNYTLQATYTAEAMAAEGDTTGAVDLIRSCLTAFPDERWHYNRIMLKPIELLWDLDHGGMADSLARLLVHNLKTRPEVVGPVDGVATDPDDRSIRNAVMERLRTKATEHQRVEFRAFLDAQPKGWPDPLVVKQHWTGAARPKDVKRKPAARTTR